jgi:integrase
MGRPKKTVPTYSKHKASGQARVRIGGKDIYLGPYNSKESRLEYDRIRAELETGETAALSTTSIAHDLTVAEVVKQFWNHAKRHYRDSEGQPTSEIKWIASSIKLLVELYGHTTATKFGPLALKAIRAKWVKEGICRKSVNGRVNRVRRLFKWAASEELIPFATYEALTTVEGLEAGRTDAKEKAPVEPVLNLHVITVLPHLFPVLRSMVMIQRLTGMRPGELVRMKVGEVNRSVLPWVYSPRKHKTSYRGGIRQVWIGPIAAEILAPYLNNRQPDDYAFTPKQARDERYAMLRAKRKSKVQPSQRCRAKPPSQLQVKPLPRFSCPGYAASIRRACRKAGVPCWFPNQTRHTFATEARELFGLDVAQSLLGHSKADVTQVYAARGQQLAVKAVGQIG